MRRADVCALLAMAVGIAGVALLRPGLAAEAHAVRVGEDVVLLPAPRETKLLSLGHKAAVVDYLWGKTLVEYGMHAVEKRAFDVERYLDTILELEPDYAPLYGYVDTLLVYRPPIGTEHDARKARAYLERGTRERPFDHKVWLQYGQFMAFLSPSFLKEQTEIDAWKETGARALMRAVELGADADSTLSATSMLAKFGARDAAIKHLIRSYELTDDPELRQQILAKLERLQDADARQQLAEGSRYVEMRRLQEAPSIPPKVYQWLGPLRDPIACLDDTKSAACAATLSLARERERGANP